MLDLIDLLNLDDWAIYGVSTGELVGTISVSKIKIGKTKDGKNKTLGSLFPDITIKAVQINSFFTTGPQKHSLTAIDGSTKEVTISRGMYVFAGTSGGTALVKELFNFLIGFVKNILKPIPGIVQNALSIDKLLRLPPDFGPTNEQDLLGAGITINQARTGKWYYFRFS